MLFKGMIIQCNLSIGEERSIRAIYHLLTGKKSIQTVQDAHMYNLHQFYGVFDQLHPSDFDQKIHMLVHEGYLTSSTETTCRTTVKGMNWLTKNYSNLPFKYFHGLDYHAVDNIFLERILLLIQVLANKKMNQTSYIPVIDRLQITNWMKPFYQSIKENIDVQLMMIYQELHLLLERFSKQEASIFVDRLTGYQHYGLSLYQIADQYRRSVEDVHLLLIGMAHNMLDHIQNNKNKYPFFSHVISDLSVNDFITKSAHHTYLLIKKGCTPEEVSRKRRLKINTIYDHIVEISLFDQSFSIDPYVCKQKQLQIATAINQTNSSKLKVIKSKVEDDITYFQIRLVLAWIKGDNDVAN